MKRISNPGAAILAALIAAAAALPARAADYKLTYNKPAQKWVEALPLGNGRIGAMVFGGTDDEHLQINEGTLWGGGPHDYNNPDAYSHLKEIQQLIFAGQVDEAQKAAAGFMGNPKLLMPYQPFCDIRMHFAGHDAATHYHRELDLSRALAETDYSVGSVHFRREAFVSYPDQVLAIRIVASEPRQIAFSIQLDSPQPGVRVEAVGNDALQLTGQIQPRSNPPQSWTGSWDRPGMRFAAVLKVIPEGGSVSSTEGRLQISGANAVTVLFSGATSFRNYRDISADALAAAQSYLRRASANHTTNFCTPVKPISESSFREYSCKWARIIRIRPPMNASGTSPRPTIPTCLRSISSTAAIF